MNVLMRFDSIGGGECVGLSWREGVTSGGHTIDAGMGQGITGILIVSRVGDNAGTKRTRYCLGQRWKKGEIDKGSGYNLMLATVHFPSD